MEPKDRFCGPLAWIMVFTLVFGGMVVGGCGKKDKAQQQAIPEVTVMTVAPRQIELTTELPGRAAAFRVAEIRPQVNGIIRERLFREGSDVAAGQVLYQIDPATFQAALENARAALGRAEANLPAVRSRADRYKELLDSRAVSKQDYDDVTAALKQAESDVEFHKAAVEAARINLGYTKVVAPISGRIGRSNVTDGALVTAHQPMELSTIQQMDPIYIDVPQSTSELLALRERIQTGSLQRGSSQRPVKIFLENGAEYAKEGTLQFQDVTVDSTTGSVILRIVVPNPKGVILPGMFVRAVIPEGVNQQAILVPQPSVMRDPKGNPFALIVDGESKVAARPLSLERAIGSRWLVSKGLAAGDNVIVEGIQKIRTGASVSAINLGVETEL
ncbi:MAG: efflux RND transporter periplasmic adaptor subunit [Syntrophorhabdaceae bacterium]|nr:efflux RND transporter periplasmic adaptor subunit [Syntrophorhabdaceae bacterium]